LKNPLKSLKDQNKSTITLDEFLSIFRREKELIFVLTQEVDGWIYQDFNRKPTSVYIASRISKEYDSKFNTKYRGILFPRAPMLRYMGNSVFFQTGTAENIH